MGKWQVIGLLTVLVLGVAAWRILSYERERNAPVAVKQPERRALTDDDAVVPKRMFINSLKSARELDGNPVWSKTGYTIPYYAYSGGHIQFMKEEGRIPPAQQLLIKTFVEATTPADWTSSIARGDKNAFVVFTEPGRDGEFAAPVATLSSGSDDWECDEIFYYQDPKTLYHWSPDVWHAVDQHAAIKGMNELQTTMALGNLQQSDSKDVGNRTVSYTTVDQGKTHKFQVAFSGDKATSVSSQ